MRKHKIWLPVAIFLSLILICGVLLPSAARIISSFPEMLVGQVSLGHETKPLSAQAYQSAEFVINQVALSEIEHAFFILVYDDVLFWGPWYVGFPRTALNEHEIRTMQQLLSAGHIFYQTPDGASFQCVTQSPLQEPRLETCRDGDQTKDQYAAYQWDAKQSHKVGVLQFFLADGQVAEIRVYPSVDGFAYTPYEMSGDWWLDGTAGSLPMLEEFSSRATLPPISSLWPEMTTDQANARAARIIGKRYQLALQIIQDSPAVRDVFGTIQEIRPAIGNNYSSSWMESSSVFLTFQIIGTNGDGAAIIQGDDCFDLQMVFQGTPIDDGSSYICP